MAETALSLITPFVNMGITIFLFPRGGRTFFSESLAYGDRSLPVAFFTSFHEEKQINFVDGLSERNGPRFSGFRDSRSSSLVIIHRHCDNEATLANMPRYDRHNLIN